MTQVADKVLAWLYNVLQDYQDPQRTYSDTARALLTFSSLSPRTEVYTYENGRSALLLTLSGTLPIDFRGTIYHFPVKSWIPQTYPQDAPMVYVTPARDMLVRPGQHVGMDGRVYHPYLRDWNTMGQRASITECFDHVQQAFVKEPPVISKAHQQQYQQRPSAYQHSSASGHDFAPPQLPPKQRYGGMDPVEMPTTSRPTPPPKPPKSHEHHTQQLPPGPRNLSQTGPPLPPLPSEASRPQHYGSPGQFGNGYPMQVPHSQSGRPRDIAPTIHRYHQDTPSQRHMQRRAQSPVSPVSPVARLTELPQRPYSQVSSPPYQQRSDQYQPYPNQPVGSSQSVPQMRHPVQYQHAIPPFAPNQHGQGPLPPPIHKVQAPPDLLSDPFDISIPEQSISGPGGAPPIPPNPEKEHLLHALSVSLVSQAQSKLSQNLSRLAPLRAQEQAIHAAHARLDSEIQQLEHLSKLLESNEAILHRSVQDCETTITSAKSKPLPPIDEVLMAPTLVAQQLWTLSAEEAGCREAMYVLQKSLDQGRISGEVFVRQMRSIGRERFLKMVLVRKCAKGLGLEMGRR